MTYLSPARLALLAALAAAWPGSSHAHPHVWISVTATVLFDKGAITGLRQDWTFDEYYSADASQGLDTNGDGQLDRQELMPLAEENVGGLAEFSYFTFAKADGKSLAFAAPHDYYLTSRDNILTLTFTLPLAKPLPADAGFTFTVSDASFFIAFEFAKSNPVVMGPDAPGSCVAKAAPQSEDGSGESAAGFGMFGAAAASMAVSCPAP
jgi:ABC-type uncharacterized transport system substrate-binding protein